ncbi:flagellar biosynthetic protein FliR [Marivita lacus]|uniref:Flagellar biosynthetic protein FliR n=1 Tax=Marivita lacus TaxID=1323742 RepID=A0ABQ1LEP0_9RHOB|nr:flagellar biosynthetic protein FliR [Marivita lacus]GGC22614.1 flagellar biosynthetic protein FliR [Marivita lacus]
MLGDLAASSTGVPGLELAALTDLGLQFLFAMLRIGAFVLSAPLFAARFVSLPVRIIISVCIALWIVQHVPMPDARDLASLQCVTWVLRELAIGLAAGLVLQIYFTAAVMAGDRIANTAGLGLAAQIDPSTGSQTPVIGQFFMLFLLAVFVAADGHLVAIRLVLQSYTLLPPGSSGSGLGFTDDGLAATGEMFTAAVRLMMPVVSVLLLLNIVIGVITRSSPQLNIFAFGFPLTMTVTLLLLFLTTVTLGDALLDHMAQALQHMGDMLGEGTDGRK